MSQSAFSQVCNGTASFSSGPVRVSAGGNFTDGVRSYGGQLAFGAERGPFASVGLSAVDYDQIDEGGTVVGISGGYAIPVTFVK